MTIHFTRWGTETTVVNVTNVGALSFSVGGIRFAVTVEGMVSFARPDGQGEFTKITPQWNGDVMGLRFTKEVVDFFWNSVPEFAAQYENNSRGRIWAIKDLREAFRTSGGNKFGEFDLTIRKENEEEQA